MAGEAAHHATGPDAGSAEPDAGHRCAALGMASFHHPFSTTIIHRKIRNHLRGSF